MPVFNDTSVALLAEMVKVEISGDMAKNFAQALESAAADWDKIAAFTPPPGLEPWMPISQAKPWRDDVVVPSLSPADATAASAKAVDNLFRVPEIL